MKRSFYKAGTLGFLIACGNLTACGNKGSEPVKAGPDKDGTGSAKQGPTASPAAQDKFNQALAELDAMNKAGKVDLVALKKAFQEAVSVDDTFAEAHYNLGVIAEGEKQPAQARKEYERALQLNPKLAIAAQNLAAVLVQDGKTDDAVKLLEAFIKNDPSQPRLRVVLAQIFRDRKKYEDALEQCRAALQRDPRNLEAFETMSGTYADMGNPPMSRLVAARGLKVDDKDAAIHYTRGRLLLNENKIPEAVLEYKRAIEANPDLRQARIDLAEVALNYRDFGNAKLHYSELLRATPNDVNVLINLGIANKGLGLGDEAKAAYEKALTLDKGNPSATMNLAILYHKNMADFPNALKYYLAYQNKPAAEGGPDQATLKGAITELEQTIAAMKEMEKMQEMENQAASQQAAQGGGQAPTPDGAPASQPAPNN